MTLWASWLAPVFYFLVALGRYVSDTDLDYGHETPNYRTGIVIGCSCLGATFWIYANVKLESWVQLAASGVYLISAIVRLSMILVWCCRQSSETVTTPDQKTKRYKIDQASSALAGVGAIVWFSSTYADVWNNMAHWLLQVFASALYALVSVLRIADQDNFQSAALLALCASALWFVSIFV